MSQKITTGRTIRELAATEMDQVSGGRGRGTGVKVGVGVKGGVKTGHLPVKLPHGPKKIVINL